jgi:hypothetical protein
MDASILAWGSNEPFTVKLDDGRELMMVFNDSKSAMFFGLKLRQAFPHDRNFAVLKVSTRPGEDIQDALNRVLPKIRDVPHVEQVFEGTPLFDAVWQQLFAM